MVRGCGVSSFVVVSSALSLADSCGRLGSAIGNGCLGSGIARRYCLGQCHSQGVMVV